MTVHKTAVHHLRCMHARTHASAQPRLDRIGITRTRCVLAVALAAERVATAITSARPILSSPILCHRVTQDDVRLP